MPVPSETPVISGLRAAARAVHPRRGDSERDAVGMRRIWEGLRAAYGSSSGTRIGRRLAPPGGQTPRGIQLNRRIAMTAPTTPHAPRTARSVHAKPAPVVCGL